MQITLLRERLSFILYLCLCFVPREDSVITELSKIYMEKGQAKKLHAPVGREERRDAEREGKGKG